jgi:hypothetical protein
LWYIVGVNGSFEGDVSDFVNDQQWVEVAQIADYGRPLYRLAGRADAPRFPSSARPWSAAAV